MPVERDFWNSSEYIISGGRVFPVPVRAQTYNTIVQRTNDGRNEIAHYIIVYHTKRILPTCRFWNALRDDAVKAFLGKTSTTPLRPDCVKFLLDDTPPPPSEKILVAVLGANHDDRGVRPEELPRTPYVRRRGRELCELYMKTNN